VLVVIGQWSAGLSGHANGRTRFEASASAVCDLAASKPDAAW
jgi:hypothetical protein